jgi:hypothetical protein
LEEQASEFGINGGWGGLRTLHLLTNLMQIQQTPWQFYKDGQTKEKDMENFGRICYSKI